MLLETHAAFEKRVVAQNNLVELIFRRVSLHDRNSRIFDGGFDHYKPRNILLLIKWNSRKWLLCQRSHFVINSSSQGLCILHQLSKLKVTYCSFFFFRCCWIAKVYLLVTNDVYFLPISLNKLYTFSWLSVFFYKWDFLLSAWLHEPCCGDVYPDVKPSRYRNLRWQGWLGRHVITKVDLLDFIHVLFFLHVLYSHACWICWTLFTCSDFGERERAQPSHEIRLILKGYSRDSKFDQNTVRDSGNVYGIRDLTFTWEAGFARIWARYARLGKKTIFGMVMTEVRDAGFLWKRSGMRDQDTLSRP